MSGVLFGFLIIAIIVFVGWLVARLGLVDENAQPILARLSFFVLTPALLLTVVSSADVDTLLSVFVPASVIAAVSSVAVAAFVARVAWRRGVGEVALTAAASGSGNAAYIGIPVALYVLGDAALAVPILLINVMFISPISLMILDSTRTGRVSVRRAVLQPLKNPITIASTVGLLLAFTGLEVPDIVVEPFRVVGAAAVPIMLLLFGMSLRGNRPLSVANTHGDVWLIFALKSVFMPLVAWLVGSFVLGLESHSLLAVVVLAALPSAQHVYLWALRYDLHVVVIRDAVAVTTITAVPILILISVLLTPTS